MCRSAFRLFYNSYDEEEVLKLSHEKRQDLFLSPAKKKMMPNEEYLTYLFRDMGVRALVRGLITLEQAAAMPDANYLKFLLTENGLNAMKFKLLTPEQAASMPSAAHLEKLLSGFGFRALFANVVTADKIAAMKDINEVDRAVKRCGSCGCGR